MRHKVKGKKLGRDVPHRKATLKALSTALIREHRIVTTVAKAKALRSFFEPLVTRAKEDNSHNRRQVFSKLQDKKAVSLLFEEVAEKAKDRPGGYTRVIKAGFRKGDGAEMAVIELVDYNDIKPQDTGSSKKKTRRAGRSKKVTSASGEKKDTKQDQKAGEEEQSADETVENKEENEEAEQEEIEAKKKETKEDSEAEEESDQEE